MLNGGDDQICGDCKYRGMRDESQKGEVGQTIASRLLND